MVYHELLDFMFNLKLNFSDRSGEDSSIAATVDYFSQSLEHSTLGENQIKKCHKNIILLSL